MKLTRREWIKNSALLAAMINTGFLYANTHGKKIRIGACDWSLGKNSDPGSFDVAKQIGLAGVQLNLGSEKNNMHLRDADIQKVFIDESKRTGIKIASLAIGELNNIPYKSKDISTEICNAFGCNNIADVKVVLSVGSKTISIVVCERCKTKFE